MPLVEISSKTMYSILNGIKSCENLTMIRGYMISAQDNLSRIRRLCFEDESESVLSIGKHWN